jgi:AcrR family transcriptional regulator
MPTSSTSRGEATARIFAVFRDRGFEGATLAELARATGLGKSSLYHYFPNGKDDMVLAVFDLLDQWLEENMVKPLQSPGTPAQRLRTILRALDELYDGGRNACVLGVLVVGGARERFQARLKASFKTWIGAMRDLAVEAGVARREAQHRAENVVIRIQGALILAGGLGDPEPFRRELRQVEQHLLAG